MINSLFNNMLRNNDHVHSWLRVAGLALYLTTLAPGWSSPAHAADDPRDDRRLEIVTADNKSHRFQVEVARTPEQQSQGLMFRRSMAPDAGMLFLNDPPRVMTMWMRNTFLPLDMIFFDQQGRVTRIVERTVPLSEAIIPSGSPVQGVLEVNAGTAAKLGLKPGDRLVHPLIRRPN